MLFVVSMVIGLLGLIWIGALAAFRKRQELRTGGARDFVYPVLAMLIALAWTYADPGSAAGRLLGGYVRYGVAILALMTLTWCVSLAIRDASIIDIVYPLTAMLPLAFLLAGRATWSAHELILLALPVLWSLRLAGHVARRNLGHGEDPRYAGWRRRFGSTWWWWSYFQVFALQGVLVWLWCLPLALAFDAAPHGVSWQHALALVLFIVGFVFQTAGDAQLERFKRTRTDRAQVLDTGLWSLSRHPNYFGEVMIWWSFWVLSLLHSWGWASIVCPLSVTWFMSVGSATPMQERYLAKTKPSYADYMKRVPAFFPWGRAG